MGMEDVDSSFGEASRPPRVSAHPLEPGVDVLRVDSLLDEAFCGAPSFTVVGRDP